MFCPNCGRQQPDSANFCQGCGASLQATPATTPGKLTEADRAARLDAEIRKYLADGYRVIAKTSTTAQLVKPNQFGCGEIVVGVLTLGILLLVFLLRKEQTVYLEVDATGRVIATGSGVRRAPPTPEHYAAAAANVLAESSAGSEPTVACPTCGEANPPGRATCRKCMYPL